MSLTFPLIRTSPGDGISEASLFSLPTPSKRASVTILRAYAATTDSFYWKSATVGNTKTFSAFLHQLRARTGNKTIAIILDNASIHRAKRVRQFTEKHSRIKLFFLPPYSPEYNPTEQVWKWAKPLVHAAKTITGGIEELRSRFHRTIWAWTHERLACPPKIGIGVWESIC